MFLPEEITKIVAEYVGFVEKKYKPREHNIPPDILWKNKHLIEYLCNNMLETIKINDYLLHHRKDRKSIDVLKEFFSEKDPRISAYIFPIFYGNKRIKEYTKKYKCADIILKILSVNYSKTLGALYIELFKKWVNEPCIRVNESFWSIFSRYNDDYKLFVDNYGKIRIRELLRNKNRAALDFWVKVAKKLLYYKVEEPMSLFQRCECNADYFLIHTEKIIDDMFMQNPHPNAVNYYLNNPEKINSTFASNKNPAAIKYMSDKYLEGIFTYPNTPEIIRILSRNSEAVFIILKNVDKFIYSYSIGSNKKYMDIYSKYPHSFEIPNIYTCVEYGHIRDNERELEETAKYIKNMFQK